MSRGLILTAALLAGCATTKVPAPPPRVIEVPGPVEYIPVPPELTMPCLASDIPPQTNGEMLRQWRARGDALADCNRRMDEIRKLQER